MKNRENNTRFVKQVFGKIINNSKNSSRYPLGEDFYNVRIEDKELITCNTSKIKVSKKKAAKGYSN